MRFDYSSDVHSKQTFVQEKETARELTDEEYEQIKEREGSRRRKITFCMVYTREG